MILYDVTAHVAARGHTYHAIIAESDAEAIERFRRAYSKRKVSNAVARPVRVINAPQAEGGTLQQRVYAALPETGGLPVSKLAKSTGAESRVVSGALRRLQVAGLVRFEKVDSAGGLWGRV